MQSAASLPPWTDPNFIAVYAGLLEKEGKLPLLVV